MSLLVRETIKYILELNGGSIAPMSKLGKLLYLLEYQSFRNEGRPFLGLEFYNAFYGPYIPDFANPVYELVKNGEVEIEKIENPFSPDCIFRVRLKGRPEYQLLNDELRAKIRKYVSPYLTLNLHDLVDTVCETEPFMRTPFGEKIKF